MIAYERQAAHVIKVMAAETSTDDFSETALAHAS